MKYAAAVKAVNIICLPFHVRVHLLHTIIICTYGIRHTNFHAVGDGIIFIYFAEAILWKLIFMNFLFFVLFRKSL